MIVNMLGWEFPPFVAGGLGVHCEELTNKLAELGVRINFFMPKTEHEVDSDKINIIEVGKNNFRIIRVGAGQINPYISPYSTPTEQGKTKNNVEPIQAYNFFDAVNKYNEAVVKAAINIPCDVIHCHDWITAHAGITLKKLTGKPLVITIHSTEYDRTGNIYPWKWILKIEQEAIDNADQIITVSNRMKQQLMEKYSANPDKITVVYNGINPNKFAAKNGGQKSRKMVLFLGRLTNQKGPEFFLQAAKKVLENEPETLFVVAGKGPLMPQLIDQALHLGIADKVMFTGYLPEKEQRQIYGLSDVYVMPSVSEPFGITALEAMASGTPTIVSKTSGVSEISHHALKVDFWDTNKMAEKIIALLRYKPLKQIMAHNALREIKDFTWTKTAEETRAVYEKTR